MKDAIEFNKQGMILASRKQYEQALDFFSKAIEIAPEYPDPYQNRGEILMQLNRTVEGNTDIQRARHLRQGNKNLDRKKKLQEKPVRIKLEEVDSIYDTVFPDEITQNYDIPLDFDQSYYDYVFADDVIPSEDAWDSLVRPTPAAPVTPVPETTDFPALLEFLGGKRIEVARVRPFQPTIHDISLIRDDGYTERVIQLNQLRCIRMAGMPSEFAVDSPGSNEIEVIETVDGNIYYEAIQPIQDVKSVLMGFSTKKETRFPRTLIPAVNIKDRYQKKLLGEILVEKQFITSDSLKEALDEYQHSKSMRLGQILAQQAKIHFSIIDEELKKSKGKRKKKGRRAGEILVSRGMVSKQQVIEGLEHQEKLQKEKIGEFLIEKGVVQEKEVYLALAEKFHIPFVDLRQQKVSRNTLFLLPREVVMECEVLPLLLAEGRLTVATLSPRPAHLSEQISKVFDGGQVSFVLVQPSHLRNIISLLYKKIRLGN